MALVVLEIPSEDTLNEESYLAANPDIRAAGMGALDHFLKHGKEEGRQQFTQQYLNTQHSYRAEKFKKFAHILKLDDRNSLIETFPISIGNEHFDISDYATESANPGFGPFHKELETNPDQLYLDIGCGFRNIVYPNCLYLEVYPSRTADILVAPTCLYPIKSSSLDGIGCFAVLEHTRKPWLVVQEIQRMLKPGGRAFIDWPFLQPVHGFPSHFFNATREGLCSLFEDSGFSIEYSGTGPHQTPAYTVQWILREMLAQLPEGCAKESFRNINTQA